MLPTCLPVLPKKRRRGQRGQSLVEFALVAPLLLLVIFGTIEFCFLYQTIDNVSFGLEDTFLRKQYTFSETNQTREVSCDESTRTILPCR